MRTIKEILASGEQIDKYNILLKDGTHVEGFLVQERIDKEHDNEGYNVYDMRTTYETIEVNGKKYDVESFYGSLEPNVMVDWADSIATKQTIDFGEDGFKYINNDDIIEWEREKIENGEYDDNEDE